MAAKGVSTTAGHLEYNDYIRLIDELESAGESRWELICILAYASLEYRLFFIQYHPGNACISLRIAP